MANMLPAVFFGHGNPMNAVMHNSYTDTWRRMGEEMPRPKAILSISAHWYVADTGVTVSTAPRTIHDFSGFPRELYEVPLRSSQPIGKSSDGAAAGVASIRRQAIPRSRAGFNGFWPR
jgi:aromatic ring-opening dioxygenase catalytic subunit (LigB family)